MGSSTRTIEDSRFLFGLTVPKLYKMMRFFALVLALVGAATGVPIQTASDLLPAGGLQDASALLPAGGLQDASALLPAGGLQPASFLLPAGGLCGPSGECITG